MTGQPEIAQEKGYQEYDPSTYWLAPARNFRTSARLHLQHHLFQSTTGCVLEPSVQDSVLAIAAAAAASTGAQRPLRVADLACGNGAWLLDLADELSRRGCLEGGGARLDGFDVNPVNLPASAFLPAGVALHELDVLGGSLPPEMLGSYDLVHMRAVVSLVRREDTAPLLSAARALLRPGGWLQWEESPPGGLTVEAPPPPSPSPFPTTATAAVTTEACDAILQILALGGAARGLTYGFVEDLDGHLTQNGFAGPETRRCALRPRDYKAWTEDYLMVWEELAGHFPPQTQTQTPEQGQRQGQNQMTREAWTDLFDRAVRETERGVVVHQGSVITAVGRKPAE